MDISKVDLNKPAFGVGAQTIEEIEKVEPEAPKEPSAEEPKEAKEQTTEEVEVKEEKEPEDGSEEKPRVTYSRFKNVHQRAIDAEREAAEWKARAEAAIKPTTETTVPNDVPQYWLEMYGDSEASQRAWKIQRDQMETVKQEAREEALKAIREERSQEERRSQENLDTIEESLVSLTAFVGRDLTDKEQSAVLDIVDDYTPKDKDGNYLGAMIPFEKAWEIYELKNQATKAPKIESRNAVASLTGSQTQGETSIAEKDKNFNPMDWNAWKKRL